MSKNRMEKMRILILITAIKLIFSIVALYCIWHFAWNILEPFEIMEKLNVLTTFFERR